MAVHPRVLEHHPRMLTCNIISCLFVRRIIHNNSDNYYRWTHAGLKWLNDHFIFPFCIGSHTSAWAQANDCGINAKFKAEYGRAKKDWRILHPFSLFDRQAYNKCLYKCMMKIQTDQAAELSAWEAKVLKYKELGIEGLPPGKPGNCVTRMWAKTGWCPLRKDSELWEQVLSTVGERNKPLTAEAPQVCRTGRSTKDDVVIYKFKTLDDRDITIRKIVLDGFNGHFLQAARELEEEKDKVKAKGRKRNRSLPSTYFGSALTVGGQLTKVKDYEEEQATRAAEKKKKKISRSKVARVKAATTLVHLAEAKEILRQCDNDKEACSKALFVRHLKALLIDLGADKKLMSGVNKSGLLSSFWTMAPDGLAAWEEPEQVRYHTLCALSSHVLCMQLNLVFTCMFLFHECSWMMAKVILLQQVVAPPLKPL